MHRVKRLEFSHVVMHLPESMNSTDPRDKSLLYVAANQLGITNYGVDLCVEAPHAEMIATIKSSDLAAKQPLRTARTRRRRYESHVDVGPMTALPDPVQLNLVQELVHGIANELQLAGDPFFGGGGKPFLEIEAASIESVLRTFK